MEQAYIPFLLRCLQCSQLNERGCYERTGAQSSINLLQRGFVAHLEQPNHVNSNIKLKHTVLTCATCFFSRVKIQMKKTSVLSVINGLSKEQADDGLGWTTLTLCFTDLTDMALLGTLK